MSASNPVTAQAAPGGVDLGVVARYSVPIHVVLPWALWGLAFIDPEVPMWLFVGFHLAFPVVLIATYRYWRGQGIELALLVVFNHLATFVSGAVASWVATTL